MFGAKKNGDFEVHRAAAPKVKLSASNESVAAVTIPKAIGMI